MRALGRSRVLVSPRGVVRVCISRSAVQCCARQWRALRPARCAYVACCVLRGRWRRLRAPRSGVRHDGPPSQHAVRRASLPVAWAHAVWCMWLPCCALPLRGCVRVVCDPDLGKVRRKLDHPCACMRGGAVARAVCAHPCLTRGQRARSERIIVLCSCGGSPALREQRDVATDATLQRTRRQTLRR